jgi:VanZ family protein
MASCSPGVPGACILKKSPVFAGERLSIPRKRLFLHWLPALAGIAVIVVESTAMMSASNTSRWLLPIWIKLFGPVEPARWDVIHHYIRKSGHFAGYGAISLGFFDAWRTTLYDRWPEFRARFWREAGLALLCTLLLASWDEWHQSFIPGRTSTPRDVALDFCGAVIAHLLLMAVTRPWRERQAVRVSVA